MEAALLVVNLINAALTAGLNLMPLLERVSSLIQQRRAEGGSLTAEDLAQLLNEGDELERQVRTQFQASLGDPNTPNPA